MNWARLPAEAERLVEAAKGWLGLGNWLAANEELEEIEASLRAHPEVLAVRSRVYAAAGKVDEAAMIARAGLSGVRKEDAAETLYAMAVAGCKAGRLVEGRRWLMTALEWGGKEMKLRALEDARLEVLWIGE